jgi:hypothetical protein
MDGRVCLVTGSESQALAMRWLGRSRDAGQTVVMLCRDAGKGEAARQGQHRRDEEPQRRDPGL